MITFLRRLRKKKLFSQIVGFLISGGTANLVSFVSYISLFKIINLNIFISSVIGQILGVLTNYIITSRFVFMKKLVFKMKTVFLSYYLITIYIVGILIQTLNNNNIEYRLSWLLSILPAACCNFLFLKFIAYKR